MCHPWIPNYNFYLIVISFVIPELKIYQSLLILSKNIESEIVSTMIYIYPPGKYFSATQRRVTWTSNSLKKSNYVYVHAFISGEEILFYPANFILCFG